MNWKFTAFFAVAMGLASAGRSWQRIVVPSASAAAAAEEKTGVRVPLLLAPYASQINLGGGE